MTENIDLLNEAFVAHEQLAPNPGDVLERANKLAGSYRRRRRAAKAAGASVLGAGIVAGGVALPGRHWGSASNEVATAAPAASGNSLPVVTTTSATYTHEQGVPLPVPRLGTSESLEQKAVDAFFAAGYDYQDAVTLSGLWHETDTFKVKAEAGQKLLDGQQLPITPSPSSGASSSPMPGAIPPVSSTTPNPAFAAYFDGGYNYDDAVALAKLWHQTDISKVKADAGQKLLDGQKLPIAP